MSRFRAISDTLSDEVWGYAIIVGLASVPFTIVLYWQSYPNFRHHIFPVFFAGLLVGCLANRRGIEAGRIGKRTGLVAALPVLWPFFDLLVFISGLSQPRGFEIMAVVFISAVVIGMSVLAGMVGSLLGNWSTEKITNFRLLTSQLAT